MTMRVGGENLEILRLKSQIFDIQIQIEVLGEKKSKLMKQLVQAIAAEKEEQKKIEADSTNDNPSETQKS